MYTATYNNATVAVKVLPLSDGNRASVISEIKTLRSIPEHCNVLHVIGLCTDNVEKDVWIVTEYCVGGSVSAMLATTPQVCVFGWWFCVHVFEAVMLLWCSPSRSCWPSTFCCSAVEDSHICTHSIYCTETFGVITCWCSAQHRWWCKWAILGCLTHCKTMSLPRRCWDRLVSSLRMRWRRRYDGRCMLLCGTQLGVPPKHLRAVARPWTSCQ